MCFASKVFTMVIFPFKIGLIWKINYVVTHSTKSLCPGKKKYTVHYFSCYIFYVSGFSDGWIKIDDTLNQASPHFRKFGRPAMWSFTLHQGKRSIGLCPLIFCWLSYYSWLLWLAQWLSSSSRTSSSTCMPLKPEESLKKTFSKFSYYSPCILLRFYRSL